MQDKRPRFARPQSFSDWGSPQFALINNAYRLRIARNRHRPRHQMVGQIPSARVSAPSQLHPAGLAADVERLRTLAHEGDATAARRASSEALIWLSYCHLAPPVAAGAPLTRRPRPWGSLTEVNGGCLGEERQEYIMSRSRQPAQVMVPSDPWVRDPLHAYTPAARREIACAGALSINDLQSLGVPVKNGVDASEANDERDPYHPPFLKYIWEAASSRPLPIAFWRGTGAGNTDEVLGTQ